MSSSTLYRVEPFTLNQNAVYTLAEEVDSIAILSATFPDDIEIALGNGGGFNPFPADGSLEFAEPVVVRVRNTNGSANTIEVGSGSAKFRRNLSSGGVVVVSGTVATSVANGQNVTFGAQADAAAGADTGVFSFMSLFKRSLASLTLIISGAVTNAASIVTAITSLSAKFGALVKSVFTLDAAAGTNDTLIITGARLVYGIDIFNASAATIYLRLYDKATAPIVGTDIPYRVYAIPTLQSMHLQWAYGDRYLLGLGLGLTAGAGYLDATVVAAHDAQVVVIHE